MKRFLYFILITSTICISLLSCNSKKLIESQYSEGNHKTPVDTRDTLNIPDVEGVTSIILVRHAEKSAEGKDPDLTQVGRDRAEELVKILSKVDLDRIYSTNYNRTQQTANPVAKNKGLTIINYGGFDHDEVIIDILENEKGGKILIVGHSNTTPNFLNALTGTSNYPNLSGDSYSDLFVVSVKTKGDSEVIHLEY